MAMHFFSLIINLRTRSHFTDYATIYRSAAVKLSISEDFIN